MTSHELGRQLLEGPNLPVALLDYGMTSREPFVNYHLFSELWTKGYRTEFGAFGDPIVLIGGFKFEDDPDTPLERIR